MSDSASCNGNKLYEMAGALSLLLLERVLLLLPLFELLVLFVMLCLELRELLLAVCLEFREFLLAL